jgi:3-oxoacyl-[acyl-carrier protein] reductase
MSDPKPPRTPFSRSPAEGEPTVASPGRSVEDAVEQLIDEVGIETRSQPWLGLEGIRGKAAIVTGGSSGIGKAICIALAQSGVHVAFNYLDTGEESREEANAVLGALRELEVRTYFAPCDVGDPEASEAFVGDAVDRLGGVQILVNNAGIGRDRALWRMSDEEWRAVMATNLDGAFHFTRSVAPYMRAQEWGKIVNITSVHGLRSEFGLSNYAASKAGMIGLTRSSAVELGPKNINVNAVAPGYIRTTRLTAGVPAEILDQARERSVLGRLGDPQDVAGVVLFLCSEAARHLTGTVIPVDGGYLL